MDSKETVSNLNMKTVYRHFYLKQPISTIAFELGVSNEIVRALVKKFRACLKIRTMTNKKFLGKKRLLKANHLNFIQSLITS